MELPEPAARPVGELIVLTGRLKGSRRALSVPVTLLGRDPTCDVCLNFDGISPLEVALVDTPAGPVLRELVEEGCVLVNGMPSDNRLLRDGDFLAVGPFQFQLSLPETPAPVEEEGLRVQAAAVAAEQVRLTELEIKLEQRRLALETQEQQLAAHLEEKRAKLESLQQQVKDERQQWRTQRETEENELAAHRTALATQREEFEEKSRRDTNERRQTQERYNRACEMRDEVLDRRERELDAQQQTMERDRARLTRDREAFDQIRLRLNGDVELGRRQLLEEREALAVTQHQWEIALHHEEQERRRKEQELAACQEELTASREALAAEQVAWHKQLATLQHETRGLENRVQAQRARLAALEQEVRRCEITLGGRPTQHPTPVVPQASPVTQPAAPAQLRELAAHLADQRLHLAEQCQRLVEQQHRWEEERDQILRDLDAAATELAGREQALVPQEADLAEMRASLARLEQALEQRQTWLNGYEVRLRLQGIDQSAEFARIQSETAAREQAATELVQAVQVRLAAEHERTRKALRRLNRARKDLESLCGQYAELWREQQEARRATLQAQQQVARQQMALTRLRDELLGRAANDPAAERRLERLENEYISLWAREEADLEAEWKALDRERELLEALAQEDWTKLVTAVREIHREQEGSTRQAQRQAEAEASQAEAADRWQRLEAERDRAVEQVEELRAELERIALTLLGETESVPTALPAQSAENQAA
jgi:hypothetical protein